jgi:hypothetical protein
MLGAMARRWRPPKKNKPTSPPGAASGKDQTAQDWSALLTGAERERFVEAIQEDMQRRNIAVQMGDGYFDGIMQDGTALRCGFFNLAVACGATSVDRYPEVIRAHFDRVLPPLKERPPAPPPSLEALAPHLRAHLYTTEMLPKDTRNVIRKHLAEDLWIVLVVDFGNALVGLSPEAVEHLRRPHEELLRIAIENMEREHVKKDSIPLPGNQQGFLFSCEEPTAASQILYLSNHLGHHYPAGALVSFPTRYEMACLPLQTGKGLLLIEAIRAFLFTIHKLHLLAKNSSSNKPFSPQFYWWRDGTLRLFPTKISPTDIFLMPPQDFIDEVLGPGQGAR